MSLKLKMQESIFFFVTGKICNKRLIAIQQGQN